jgi:hypothetical protein
MAVRSTDGQKLVQPWSRGIFGANADHMGGKLAQARSGVAAPETGRARPLTRAQDAHSRGGPVSSSFFDYPTELPAPPARVDYFLADATDDDWAALLGHTRPRWLGAGEAVIRAGETGQSLYLILDGRLEVLVDRGRRGHQRVASLGAGSVIGELAFFDGGARSALVRAVTPAELAELPRAEFDALADAHPALARRLLLDLGRILAQRLRASQLAASAGAA